MPIRTPFLPRRIRHWVRCRHCRTRFDLLVAKACACVSEHRTRTSVVCGFCLCADPVISDPEGWILPPVRLRPWFGSEKMPVDYL